MAKPVRLVFLADDNQLRSALAALVSGTAATDAKLRMLQKTGADMQRVGRSLTIGITLPVLAAAGASAFLSARFEESMTKVQTLAGASRSQMQQWSDEVLRLAPAVAKSPQDLADALYFIVSSGAKASDAMNILTSSAKASAAGLGDTKVIADAVTSAMNAYGDQNLSAARATDILVRAVKDGKGEAADLAQSIGLVVPIAAKVGVGFDQVAGAMAALTQTGSSTAEASTQLRNIFTEILHPSAAVTKELKSMGISSADLQAELRDKGLLATLQDLHSRVGDNDTAFAKMFPNVRGLLGALSLVGPNGQQAADVLKDVAAAGGDVNQAFDTTKQTKMFQWKDALASLQVVGIKVGNDLGPAILKITSFLTGLLDRFDRLSPSARSTIETFAAVAASVGPLLYVTGNLTKTFASLARHPLIAMLLLLGTAFVTAYTRSESFRNAVNGIAHALMDAGKWISQNGTLLTTLAAGLGTFLAVARGATLISNTAKFMKLFGINAGTAIRMLMPLGGMFSKFVGGLRSAWMALNTTFLASPIGIIIAALVALGVVIYLLWTRSSTFRKIVEGAFHGIVTAVKDAAHWLKTAFTEAIDWVVGHWKLILTVVLSLLGPVGMLAAFIITHFKQVKEFISMAFKAIHLEVLTVVHGIEAAWGGLVAALSAIGHALWTVFGPQIKAIAAVVEFEFKVIWAIITGTIRLILAFVIPMIKLLVAGWELAWKGFGIIVQTIVDFIRPIIEFLVNLIKVDWQLMTTLVTTATQAIWSVLTTVWGAVKGFLTEIWGGLASIATSAWDHVTSAITSATKAVYNAITSGLGTVKTWITGLWNDVSSFIAGIWDGIVSKVKTGAQRVFDGIMGIWGKLSGAVSGAFSGIGGAVRGAINDVIGLVNRIHIPPVSVAGVTVFSGWSGFDIPYLASGAIVDHPTLAMIGEAGPELVLPLSRKQRAMELLEQSGLVTRPSTVGGGVSADSRPSYGSGKHVHIENINVTSVAKNTSDIGREVAWQVRAVVL